MSKHLGCVAAPDSLKTETFCCDHNVIINPAANGALPPPRIMQLQLYIDL